jgi:hypothetical protein
LTKSSPDKSKDLKPEKNKKEKPKFFSKKWKNSKNKNKKKSNEKKFNSPKSTNKLLSATKMPCSSFNKENKRKSKRKKRFLPTWDKRPKKKPNFLRNKSTFCCYFRRIKD